MIEVLSKPADQIRISDIESLIDSQVPESEQIEFKESLPARRKTPSIHGWKARTLLATRQKTRYLRK